MWPCAQVIRLTFCKRDIAEAHQRSDLQAALTAQGRPVVRVCPIALFGDAPALERTGARP